MLNRVMIIGRLGQDPQLKYTQTGMPIATFSVATDENFTDREGNRQQRTEWFRVVVFQKVAENCSRFLHKGSLVYVEGSLQTRKWQDQQGVDHSLVEIRAQRVDFLEKRSAQQDDYGRRSYASPEGGDAMGGGYEGEQRAQPQSAFQPQGSEERPPVFPQYAAGEAVTGPSEQNVFPSNADQQAESNADQSQLDKVPF